jgi:hypothetical protein
MTPRDTLAQPEGHIPDLIPDITTPDLGITDEVTTVSYKANSHALHFLVPATPIGH